MIEESGKAVSDKIRSLQVDKIREVVDQLKGKHRSMKMGTDIEK